MHDDRVLVEGKQFIPHCHADASGTINGTLATDEIGKSYRGRRVVNGVSLRVEQGEVVGLLDLTAPAKPLPSTP